MGLCQPKSSHKTDDDWVSLIVVRIPNGTEDPNDDPGSIYA